MIIFRLQNHTEKPNQEVIKMLGKYLNATESFDSMTNEIIATSKDDSVIIRGIKNSNGYISVQVGHNVDMAECKVNGAITGIHEDEGYITFDEEPIILEG